MSTPTSQAVQNEATSYCQGCRTLAPTRQVLFFQHIGAVVLMFNRHIRGQLCRNCVDEHFARTTLITSFLGWWGIVSCILTPFFLLNNIIRYLLCLPLKANPNGRSGDSVMAWAALVIAIAVLLAVLSFIERVIHR